MLPNAAQETLFIDEPALGLRAVVVLDDLTLGPAAGGVRTRAYLDGQAALADARALADAMTVKCALAGLQAGGGKCVVLADPQLVGERRARAFLALGAHVEALGGRFRTAGDLGTTAADLAAMARATRYVHTDEAGLVDAAARGLRGCVGACAEVKGRSAGLAGLTVAVQGAGAIGAQVARRLVEAGARVSIADLDAARAARLGAELGAEVVAPDTILAARVDVLAPCATGGVLTLEAARAVRAWAVCGAANNLFADGAAEEALRRRGVLVVPDVIASAGAVIEGVGRTVMGLSAAAREALVARLGGTAREVLIEAAGGERTTGEVARSRAARVLAA